MELRAYIFPFPINVLTFGSSHYLCFISFLYLNLYVLGDDALIS